MGSLEKSNERDISPSSVAEQAGPAGEEEGKVASTSAVDSNVIETRPWTMQVGVAEDRNGRWRRSMEDAHIFSKDFDKVPGQGYFAVFDGHAGKFAAEWCRDNMEALLMHELRSNPGMDVREVMNNVFLKADEQLESESEKAGVRSGCTAVMSLVRFEPTDAPQQQRRVLYTAFVGYYLSVLLYVSYWSADFQSQRQGDSAHV